MGGEFDEGQHPRDEAGRFTDGEGGQPAQKTTASAATKRAEHEAGRASRAKPPIDAKPEEHGAHSDRLRAAGEGLMHAAGEHSKAGLDAANRGAHDEAREHFSEARRLNEEARDRLAESAEHGALADLADRDRLREERKSAEASLHERSEGNEAADHASSPRAQGDHSKKGRAEHPPRGGHGAGHGGGHGGKKGHEAGFGHWLAEKVKEAPEALEQVREALEKVLEAEPR